MAKGQEEKLKVQNKILEVFEGSFVCDKHIRIPMGDCQIKVTLAAAKDIVEADGGSGKIAADVVAAPVSPAMDTMKVDLEQPSEIEKKNVSKLLESLGL
jgi:hypothetical protein